MSYAKEREQFIAKFAAAKPNGGSFPNGDSIPAHYAARLLLRHAKTHGNLAEQSCNGHPIQSQYPPKGCNMPAWNARVAKMQDAWDARIEKRESQIERRITEICTACGLSAHFGGDPRGYTVKIAFPDGSYNTMGGREEGWGVPQ